MPEFQFLRFVRGGPAKWYAATADGGEFAYGDGQGLYQWHPNAEGQMVMTDYSGGDRQCSSKGELWQIGRSGWGESLDGPTPTDRGLLASGFRKRMN